LGLRGNSIQEGFSQRSTMERFDVKRGLVKQVTSNGGLAVLARDYFDNVEVDGDNSFNGSHDIMTSIAASYNEQGALVVNITNVPPDFDDAEAVKSAMEARKNWTLFLDAATGYNSKQRGDKAKEWGKKASKAKSGISAARHFMSMSQNIPEEISEQAESMIEEIEAALEQGDNTKAAGRAGKLAKLLE
jgi:phage gpG-like protein